MQEGGSEERGVGSGDNADREEGDIDKEPEGHQSPKDIDEEVTEEIKWPCSVCGSNVLEDGLECVDPAGCKMWCHADCSDVLDPRKMSKPFKCPVCSDKPVSKANKAKDSKIVKKKLGRPPKNRNLSITIKNLSISSSQVEDQKAKKTNNKRNIDEVGSPEKTEKDLGASPIKSPNSKKAREGEVTHISPFKKALNCLGSYLQNVGKEKIHEGKEEEKENEGIGTENEGKKQEQETTKGENKVREDAVGASISEEKEKTKIIDQTGKTGSISEEKEKTKKN